MSQSPRSLARELVLQALYAVECGDASPDDDLFDIGVEDSPPPRAIDYARKLFELVQSNSGQADQHISSLATNWDIDRMAIVDRNILRLAIIELDHMVDVPVKVVLNEAIELAKKFSTVESSGFVNGILDQYVKGMENADRT
ncbi:MAG: transcription antitermination factor NusB [candidate division Zixibacteria bacterium]|nr:transcription antitermination factor NusB [candidate division Zixibacteria bacterium]MDH3938306.1 transcription antitermination factor NusB [candidate division Zixibacteria bacterium]MDH4035053.1 transcription antitermination factor NusB [candidate division Zixibacteria bacterium]